MWGWTYTIYSWVAEDKKVSKGDCLLNSLKGTIWKKSLGNSGLDKIIILPIITKTFVLKIITVV